MSEGIVALEINPALRDRISDELAAELFALEAKIRSGELEVPRGTF